MQDEQKVKEKRKKKGNERTEGENRRWNIRMDGEKKWQRDWKAGSNSPVSL